MVSGVTASCIIKQVSFSFFLFVFFPRSNSLDKFNVICFKIDVLLF